MTETVQHNHTHTSIPGPNDEKVRIKLIKNTKGYGWEIGTSGATVDECMNLLNEAQAKVNATYGDPEA
jgi:hypothetical protein